jgi:Fungalysin metallopeptidase (M36)
VAVTLAGMLRGPGRLAEAGPVGQGSARAIRRTALAGALVAALAAPASATATPARATAKLKAAGAPAGELKPVARIPLPGGAIVYRFQQRVSGVKVLNGQVAVIDPRGAPPDLAADSSKPGIESPPAPRLGKAAAMQAASRSLGVERLRGHGSARLAIEPGDGGRLVWRVVVPSARPLGDFEVLIDATSGGVVRKRNLTQSFRTGRAQLYNPNPVVEHGNMNRLRRDHHDRDTHLLTKLRRPVKLPKIRSGQSCLRGKWARAKLGHKPRQVCKRNLHWWGVRRSKDRFEALMVYFHITRAQRYIQGLGFSDTSRNGISDRTQVAVADAFRDDNSFFSPVTRRIEYGSGGVDDAEDADVILHEYGHAIQDAQVRWFGEGNQAGSIGEGFGDYWAAAMSSKSPGTSRRDDVCIFEWDGVSWGRFVPPFGRKCGRRADRGHTLAEAQASCGVNDIHCVGEVWSSALWDLRREIGPRGFDRIVLSSQFMYTIDERFDDAVQALIAADQASSGGANAAAICAEMETQRGISVAGCP